MTRVPVFAHKKHILGDYRGKGKEKFARWTVPEALDGIYVRRLRRMHDIYADELDVYAVLYRLSRS